MAGPVRESLKQIDADSWLIGRKFILKGTSTAATSGHLWKSKDGSFYSVGEAPDPLPQANPLPSDSPFRKIHDKADRHVAWDLGDAILKVKQELGTSKGTTEEHVTLRWLTKEKLSFAVGKALLAFEDEGRKFLIVSRLPGETIDKVYR